MLKYIRESLGKHGIVDPEPSDYFSYSKLGRVGFPSRVTCAAHDAQLGIHIIGTQEGFIHFFGGGNAHWVTHIRNSDGVKNVPKHVYAVQGKGVAIVICSCSSIYRVSIKGSTVTVVPAEKDGRCKEIRSACLLQGRPDRTALLLLGSSAGNIFKIDTDTLHFDEFIAYEMLGQNGGLSRGSIDLLSCSFDGKLVAVVISSHLIIFDSSINEITHFLPINDGTISALNWSRGNILFISFTDGTFTEFHSNSSQASLGTSKSEFGPFPAQPIRKIQYAHTKKGENPILVFCDGLPSASFGDRYAVTLKTEDTLLCFDFESPVVTFDFSAEFDGEEYYDSFLLVLTKHELVMIDLRDSRWRVLPPKYLYPMDSHTLTSTYFVTDLDEQVWAMLSKLSTSYWLQPQYTRRDNPLRAHRMIPSPQESCNKKYKRQLLITGHDDGSVHIWSAGEKCTWLMLTISTSKEFSVNRGGLEDTVATDMEESTDLSGLDDLSSLDSADVPGGSMVIPKSDEYPPFRKVGVYDPFCDDARTAVIKLHMDPSNGTLIAGTKCGTVLVYELRDETRQLAPSPQVLLLLNDPLLKPKLAPGSKPISHRMDKQQYAPGYQPLSNAEGQSMFLQLDPPTPTTAFAILPSRNLLCVANEYGVVVLNFFCHDVLMTRSFVASHDLSPPSLLDNTWGTFKSMKKSVRHTFRRKKKSSQPSSLDTTLCSDANGRVFSDSEDDEAFRPVERKVEARTLVTAEAKPWLVRTVAFLKTPCSPGSAVSDSLWIGTNNGVLLCYSILDVPKERDTLKLERELRLSHAAPIIQVCVHMEVNAKLYPHPRLIVATEEQVRLFSLPTLKALKYKVKLTSTEGLRIRKCQLVNLRAKQDTSQVQSFIFVATNNGEIRLFSSVNPRKRLAYEAINSRDHIALNSLTVSSAGELFFLRGEGSELQRTTMSSHSIEWTEPFQGSDWPLSANNS